MFATKTIGLITNNFQSLYHTPLMHMLHARLRERGYRLLAIMGTPGEIAAARVAFDRVDGWLATNTTTGIEDLYNAGKPLMLISGPHPTVPCVMSDNHGGTAAALGHLIAQGRTRIAFVTYAINSDFRERYAAYSAILADHGIALDPALVLDTQSYQVYDAYQAARRMIADGRRFDAVFCANDWLAFGIMQAIQEAGWRIPEDVAVIGFDDTIQAQFTTPPLTSVRQSPAELGRVAIGLLLDQIERGIAPPQLTTVPTELIIRQSSTAMQRFPPESADSDRYRGMDWQDQLARDLAQQTIFPVPLDPDTAAEQVWPGVGTLVASLAVAVDGCGQQEMQPGIWESIPGFQRGVAMTPIVELLRRAGVQRIDGADRGAVERLTRWLVVRQEEVTDRQLAENINQTERDRQIFDRENNLLIQLGSTNANPRLIDWMDRSQADWGMLGLWRDGRALDLASIYVRDSGTTLTDVEVAPERFPPIELLPASMRDSLEYLIKVAPLANAGRQWGYLVYAERFFWTFNDTVSNRNAYITAALEREELLSSLTERQATLQEAYDRERHLADTIRELGCPIIPLLKGVLLVPLVGAIDPARAAEIVERVLQGVAAEQAQHVLLDITGVPLVDTQVAAALIQTAQAVGLLGAKMTLVGVRPEIAQSIVGLGVDLGIMETRPTLAAALQGLIRR